MARPLRIEFPGAFYHVMNRGNSGMNIYRSEWDREKFLEYVGEAVKRCGIKVHTFFKACVPIYPSESGAGEDG